MDEHQPLTPHRLGAYFALIETTSLLRHAIEGQLRDAGQLSYVQFQLLARLGDVPSGSQRMTDLADGVVYSRSGLTYQAQLLEQRGLVTRSPADDDDRAVVVSITDAGREVLAQVFPGHVQVLNEMLFATLSEQDVDDLAAILGRVRDQMRAAPPRSASTRRRSSKRAADGPSA